MWGRSGQWGRGEVSGRVGLWVASEASLWAARGPRLRKSCRREQAIIREELHPYQGLPGVSLYSFHSGKGCNCAAAAAGLGLEDWPREAPAPLWLQEKVEFRPGQQLASWKPLTQETTLAPEQGPGRLLHWPSASLPLHSSCFPGPGAHDILTNDAAGKANHCSSPRAAGSPGTRENPNHKLLL